MLKNSWQDIYLMIIYRCQKERVPWDKHMKYKREEPYGGKNMLAKITRKIHGSDKLLTTYLNTEEVSIPVISEQENKPVELFDAEGNLVETKEPTEKWYRVVVVFKTNGYHKDYIVTEQTATELIDTLNKASK